EDGSSKEVVQVKGVASVLPEVVAIEDQMRPQSLFQASVVHVANSRYKRHARVRAENIGRQAAGARGARQHQVLVEWGLVGVRISHPYDAPCGSKVIRG